MAVPRIAALKGHKISVAQMIEDLYFIPELFHMSVVVFIQAVDRLSWLFREKITSHNKMEG